MRVNELRFCLTSLSDTERRQIAGFLDLKEENHPEAMEQKLTDPAYYMDLFQNMDHQTRQWLWSVFFRDGKIKKQALYQEKNLPLSKVEYQRLMHEACNRGWVYCLRNEHMELLYYVPWEIRVAWAKSMFHTRSFPVLDEDGVIPVITNPLKVSQAFFHLLSSLSHDPWLLNRTGRISKKDFMKMDVEFDLDDVSDSWPGWSCFLLEMARSLKLITETKKHIGVHQKRWKSWLNTSWKDSISQLYDAARHVLLKHDPQLSGYCLLLEQFPSGKWWNLEEIRRRIQMDHPLKASHELIERLQDCFLIPMACMGWLEWGETTKKEPCFKWLPYPPREWEHPGEVPVYIDPAPEIYVPYHFPWKDRYELSLWADYMGGDHMLVYEINERSLTRGLQYGWTIDRIKEKLEEWTGEIPSLFMERMQDLRKRIDAVTLSAWTCLKIEQDSKRTDVPDRLHEAGWEVKKHSDSEYFIKGTPGEISAWLIGLNEEVLIEKKDWSSCDGGEKEKLKIDFEGVLDCRVEFPKPEKIDLPKAWFSGLRPYGIKMARELVRQSISHGLPILMAYQGEKVEVHPERLRYEWGEWVLEAVIGKDRRKICLQEVEAFQMLPSSSVSGENPLQ